MFAGLRGLDDDINIAVFREHPGVDDFVVIVQLSAAAIVLDQLRVREWPLGIFVERFHIGMAWCVVEEEVRVLHILPVIAFISSQSKQTLLEDRVHAIPQRQSKVQ